MSTNRLVGTRIQFSGSSGADCEPKNLSYAHDLVRRTAERVASLDGGLVFTLVSEGESTDSTKPASTFDWTAAEGFLAGIQTGRGQWPKSAGAPMVAVGFHNWRKKISVRRMKFVEDLVETGEVQFIQLPPGFNTGGVLRQVQSSFGDMLIVIGGTVGAHHSASLYLAENRPVIPLDIPLGRTREQGVREGESLSSSAIQNPNRYFGFERGDAAAAYTLLTLKRTEQNARSFSGSLVGFLSRIKSPVAFLVRLQDDSDSNFTLVNSYFHNVLQPVVRGAGYRTYEVGKEQSEIGFMNVEIFDQIDRSSLVMVDLTSVRPNCIMELGYALGKGKRTIITAMKGTNLPFDASSIPHRSWQPNRSPAELKGELERFMSININRKLSKQFALLGSWPTPMARG